MMFHLNQKKKMLFVWGHNRLEDRVPDVENEIPIRRYCALKFKKL